MKTSESIKAISADLVKAIGAIPAIKKDAKNPFLKNKYASLDAIIETIRPILTKHNLTFLQSITEGVETTLLHTSGEWISSDVMTIPAEQSKGLSSAQARGVSITYCKRYQLGSMLGISTDEDTDGDHGAERVTATTSQPTSSTPTAGTTPADKGGKVYPPDDRPWLTEEGLKQAIQMIHDGDTEIAQKTINARRMKKEYKAQILAATPNTEPF